VAVADWTFLGVLAVSLIIGAWRGLVYEVLSVLGWALSFYLAQWMAPDVASRLPLQGASEPVRYAAAFGLVFVVAVLLAGLVAVLVKKMVEAVGLRPVDRTLGAAFGLVRGVILLLALTVVVNMTAFKGGTWWQQSRGAEVLTAALKGLKPMLPEQFAKYLITE
jgi:membrane protein required for colicin V production